MRVITGTARGIQLKTPEGVQTRPTSDRVKEALFSIIQFDIIDGSFLDLFSGSGQMGIEALSRGAERAVFVESNKKAYDCIKKNLSAVGYTDSANAIFGEVLGYLLGCREKFDVIFLDPPYSKGIIASIFESVTGVCKDNGAIICEIAKGEAMPEEANGFSLKRRYKYGKTELCLYRKSSAETEIY